MIVFQYWQKMQVRQRIPNRDPRKKDAEGLLLIKQCKNYKKKHMIIK